MRGGYSQAERGIGISPRNIISESLIRRRQYENQLRAADLRDHYLSRAGKRPVLLPDEIDDALKVPNSRGHAEAGVGRGLNPE